MHGRVPADMLTVYRRHRSNCPLRGKRQSRDHIDGDVFARKGLKNKCHCAVWIDGFIAGREIRKSLGTQNWEKAKSRALEIDRGERCADEGKISIKSATEQFVADAESRKLSDAPRKYRLLFKRLLAFADELGVRSLQELDVATLRKFRTSWELSDSTSLKTLERLRSFFKFAQECGWVKENPAKKIGSPRCEQRPTLPFPRDEVSKILTAADANIHAVRKHGRDNAVRLRALILLLRYSGLRIGDAVACSVDRLGDGKIRLYTQKTGTHVHCPIPPLVVAALEGIPKMSARYWFWSGNGRIQTAVADWQARLKKLFDDAKMQGAHAHRFRDTFATELLLAGVPIERVSVFLGHQDVRITQKHYSPWIRERQEQAEADVRRAWQQDPLVVVAGKSQRGTSEVHERMGRPN